MDENFRSKLRRIHRVNRILWTAILADILILSVIALLLWYFEILTEPLLHNIKMFNDISLIAVIILLFTIMYLKRTYLIPDKIVERAKRKELQIGSADVVDFIQEFGKEANMIAKALIIMRRYFMLIWSIANLIVLIGFISFIVSMSLRNFIIYGIVALYSLLINFPRFSIVEDCYYNITNK
ncbi:MAG: hypothetical protein JW956_13965 [Calditrichaceae bacterium]|nr:hypothetical protein [Calditrichaceae bacterium]